MQEVTSDIRYQIQSQYLTLEKTEHLEKYNPRGKDDQTAKISCRTSLTTVNNRLFDLRRPISFLIF